MAKYTQTEQNIINESREISMGESPHWTDKIFKAFPAFKHKNYQLYFLGQLVSLIGTWLQTVAQGILVFNLTHSALWVGIIFALNSIPVTLFVLFGGVIVDRFSKKKILIFTQVGSLTLAFILGILVITGVVNVIHIAILTVLLGFINAIDMPARQAFMSEIVDKEDLSSSIALNAGMFNAARVIGPLIAGILIGLIGEGGAFIVNALSFIPPIITLLYIIPKEHKITGHSHPITAIKEGVSYSYKHPIIRDLMIFAGLNGIFGWSYVTILPVIGENVFHLNPFQLSFLYAAGGGGAILGTILVSAFSHKIRPSQFILGGLTLFSIALIAFSLTSNLILGIIFLFFSGLGLVTHFSMMNTTIQHMSPPHIMGRVLSVYTFMFLGLSPLGSFEIGFVADHLGSPMALRISGIIMLVFALYHILRNKRLKDIEHI